VESGAARHFDVIVVGGRPAGSTLAACLGAAGMRVLLVERAVFPSAPAASSPIIYSSTMRLLDEIGVDEAEYARGTPPIRRWVIEIREDFRVTNPVPDVAGRDYGYAIDRARFDEALWRNAARFPSVVARQPFVVSGLVRSGDRITGIRGRAPGGAEEIYTADCVVGADGRFSLVARQAAARTLEEHTERPTTLYYAYWRNVAPYDDEGPAIHAHGPGYGYGFLLMDSADDTVAVVVEGQSSIINPGPEKAEGFYVDMLRRHPRVWRRLRHAERISEVRGMRNVGNLYRAAGGRGWALVGDALHQKDPLDGQGIFDAVFTGRALGQALIDWKRGAISWEQALSNYDAVVRRETYPMYQNTLQRVKNELYTRQPAWAFRSWIRWLLEDPEYLRRLGLVIVRGIPVTRWLPPRVFIRALGRGALRDLRRLVRRQPRMNMLPSLDPSEWRV
jgi:flavin-dependent dehydrogenase